MAMGGAQALSGSGFSGGAFDAPHGGLHYQKAGLEDLRKPKKYVPGNAPEAERERSAGTPNQLANPHRHRGHNAGRPP